METRQIEIHCFEKCELDSNEGDLQSEIKKPERKHYVKVHKDVQCDGDFTRLPRAHEEKLLQKTGRLWNLQPMARNGCRENDFVVSDRTSDRILAASQKQVKILC